jgi:hypothetical protein
MEDCARADHSWSLQQARGRMKQEVGKWGVGEHAHLQPWLEISLVINIVEWKPV